MIQVFITGLISVFLLGSNSFATEKESGFYREPKKFFAVMAKMDDREEVREIRHEGETVQLRYLARSEMKVPLLRPFEWKGLTSWMLNGRTTFEGETGYQAEGRLAFRQGGSPFLAGLSLGAAGQVNDPFMDGSDEHYLYYVTAAGLGFYRDQEGKKSFLEAVAVFGKEFAGDPFYEKGEQYAGVRVEAIYYRFIADYEFRDYEETDSVRSSRYDYATHEIEARALVGKDIQPGSMIGGDLYLVLGYDREVVEKAAQNLDWVHRDRNSFRIGLEIGK